MFQIRRPAKPGETDASHAAGPTGGERNEQERRLQTIGDAGAFSQDALHTDLKVELHQRLLDLINLSALDSMSRDQIEAEVGGIILE